MDNGQVLIVFTVQCTVVLLRVFYTTTALSYLLEHFAIGMQAPV
jgi:hypothetical protein